jgi:hypothetical protein
LNNWPVNPTGRPNSFVEGDLMQEHMNFCSVAVVVTDVFQKKLINISNKFVRIMKIFTKANDLKNRRVI